MKDSTMDDIYLCYHILCLFLFTFLSKNIASTTYLASSIRTLTAFANDGSNLVIAD